MSARFVALATAAALASVLLASPASASLPAPKSKSIVIGKSIGGVAIGASLASAKKAWGRGGACVTTSPAPKVVECTWGEAKKGRAMFATRAGKVVRVSIEPGYTPAGYVFAAGVRVFKTSKGVGLGSTLERLQAGHPNAVNRGGSAYRIQTPRGSIAFEVDARRNVVFRISVSEPLPS